MRDLTEEELKLAPEWATHYIVDSDDSIIYESAFLCWWRGLNNPLNNVGGFGKMKNRPITGREFDITQHEWSDEDIRIFPAPINGDDLTLEANCIKEYIILERKDATAIAKHFKLTAEDLG